VRTSLLTALSLLLIAAPVLCETGELDFSTSLSYPEGLGYRFGWDFDDFQGALSLHSCGEELSVPEFYFLSDQISIGSISYSGFSAALCRKDYSFYDPAKVEGPVVNREGKPAKGLGVILVPPSGKGGFSFFQKDSGRSAFLWYVPDGFEAGHLVAGQSITFARAKEEDSWYREDKPLLSSCHLHSLGALFLGTERVYSAGRIIVNASPLDSTGVSLLLTGGGELSSLKGRFEVLWFSPTFFTTDLKYSDDTLVFRGEGEYDGSFLDMENLILFRLGKEVPLGLSSEIELGNEFYIKRSRGGSFWDASLDLAIGRCKEGTWMPSVSIEGGGGQNQSPFFWKGSALAGYDKGIFKYGIKLGGGVETGKVKASLDISLKIDESITLDSGAGFTYSEESWNFSAKATFEELGIYNSAPSEWKPEFYLQYRMTREIPLP